MQTLSVHLQGLRLNVAIKNQTKGSGKMKAKIRMNKNGLKVAKIENLRPIQTNGNLPLLHRLELGEHELSHEEEMQVRFYLYEKEL